MSETNGVVATTVEVPVKVSASKLILPIIKAKGGLAIPAEDIIAKLKDEHGVVTNANLINNLKSRVRAERRERAERRAAANPPVDSPAPTMVAPVVAPGGDLFEQLRAVKALANQVGGVAALEDLLNKLKQLS